MRRLSRLFVVRLAALVGLAVSTALLADQGRAAPLLCGAGGSCETVLGSEFARVMGLPLPLLGVLGFAAVLLAALVPGTPAGRLRTPLAWLAGGVGLGLVSLQLFVLHAVCPYCLAADTSALLIAFADPGVSSGLARAEETSRKWLWLAAALAVLGIPLAWAEGPAPEPVVPAEVKALWVPGKINVIEITDFGCPYCREMDPVLRRVLREYGDRVHFVRLVVPLPSHPGARAAARAYYCACRQGQGERMGPALYAAPDFTPAAGVQLAGRLGLSVPAYQACEAGPEARQAVEAAQAWLDRSDLAGLPAVWIQGRLLVGFQTEGELRAALRQAEQER